jgi:hypothetical protein
MLRLADFVPLLGFAIAVAVLVQFYKMAVRSAGVRHHTVVESTLPWVPVAIGAGLGVLYGDAFGFAIIVEEESAPTIVAAVYGAVGGFCSSGIYRAIVDALPVSSRARSALTVHDDAEQYRRDVGADESGPES